MCDTRLRPQPAAAEAAADLMQRARNGERGALEQIIREHERQVIKVAWRLLGTVEDAEDAAQEVFLRLFRYLHRVDAGKPLGAWLYRVTVNVCHDLGRRRKRYRGQSLEETEQVRQMPSRAPDANPSRIVAAREECRIIQEALATLSEKERTVVVLRDIEGLTTAAVAKILGSSETTVRSQISRARVKIKRYRERRLKGE
jgi:RNA polymerase sigma-70 factor (ECF subfamily)